MFRYITRVSCVSLCHLITIHHHSGHVPWPLAETNVQVTIDTLVGEQCHFRHLLSLGVGSEQPPVKSVVVVETQVELFIVSVGLGVGQQKLATLGETQEHVTRG